MQGEQRACSMNSTPLCASTHTEEFSAIAFTTCHRQVSAASQLLSIGQFIVSAFKSTFDSCLQQGQLEGFCEARKNAFGIRSPFQIILAGQNNELHPILRQVQTLHQHEPIHFRQGGVEQSNHCESLQTSETALHLYF